MGKHAARVRRALALLVRQLPFLLDGAWVPEPGSLWFGPPWRHPHHHWLRMHAEALQILSAVAADPDVPTGLPEGVSRHGLIDSVERGLRAACRSHVSDGSLRLPATHGPWGDEWQGAWWAYRLVRCVHLVGSELSPATQEAVRRVAVQEADRFLGVQPPSGVRLDTKMEENGWDMPLLAWARCLYPDHPHAAGWEDAIRLWSFNTLSVEADRYDRRWMDDRPASAWFAGATLHPDFTCENHGTFHPAYQACCNLLTLTASAYLLHGRTVPPQVLHHLDDALEVLVHFNAPSGMLLMVTGNDWPAYHGALHQYWPLAAYFCRDRAVDRLADANLDLCGWLLDRSDNGHIFGSTVDQNIGEQRYFFHTVALSALADLVPALPEPAPLSPARAGLPPSGGERTRRPAEGATSAAATVRHLASVEVVTHRSGERMVAAAWRSLYGHPLFTYWLLEDPSWSSAAPHTGLGRLASGEQPPVVAVRTHTEEVGEQGFVTSGVIDWRVRGGPAWARQHLLWASLGDGWAVWLEAVRALADVALTRNEGWCFSVINDLHNGGRRELRTAAGVRHAVHSGGGETAVLELGDGCVLQDQLAVRTTAGLRYVSPGRRLGEDNSFAAAQWDRLLLPGRVGPVRAGEWVRVTGGILRPGSVLPPPPRVSLGADTLSLVADGVALALALLPPYGAHLVPPGGETGDSR